MKNKCSICGKKGKSVVPRIVAGFKKKDERFNKPINGFITRLLCKNCYQKSRVNK